MPSNRSTGGTLAIGLLLALTVAACGRLEPAAGATGRGDPATPPASPAAVAPTATASDPATPAGPSPNPQATGPQPTVDAAGLTAVDGLLHDIDAALASDGAASAQEGSDK